MKTSDLLRSAVQNTFRSRLRTVLTVAAIFIGAFTLSLTSAVGAGISSYISTQVASLGANNVLTVTKAAAATSAVGTAPQKYDPATSSSTVEGAIAGRPGAATGTDTALTKSDITTLGTVPGVETVTPSARLAPDYVEYGDHGKYQLSVTGNAALANADLAAGAQLDDSTSSPQIVLPTTYIGTLGLGTAKQAVGRTVSIGVTDYAGKRTVLTATVVGVQNATLFGNAALVNSALRTELVDTQAVGTPSTVVTTYASAVVTFDQAKADAAVDLKAALAKAGYTGETVADQLGTVQTVVTGIVAVLDAFAVIALLAASFGIVNTLLMSVQERTREIGLMKAMGMGGNRVFALFSAEAVFIGFLGSALGALIAIGLGSLLSARLAVKVFSNLPGLHLLIFQPASIVVIVLVVMLIAFLAGTLPARRAARLDPIEALRYE